MLNVSDEAGRSSKDLPTKPSAFKISSLTGTSVSCKASAEHTAFPDILSAVYSNHHRAHDHTRTQGKWPVRAHGESVTQ